MSFECKNRYCNCKQLGGIAVYTVFAARQKEKIIMSRKYVEMKKVRKVIGGM